MLPMLSPRSPVRYPDASRAPVAAPQVRPQWDETAHGRQSQVESADGAAPPKKRVITAARREQNREAQRLYRQRRREQRQKATDEIRLKVSGKCRVLKPRPGPARCGDQHGDTSRNRRSLGPGGCDRSSAGGIHSAKADQTLPLPPRGIYHHVGAGVEVGLMLSGPNQQLYASPSESSSDDAHTLTGDQRTSAVFNAGPQTLAIDAISDDAASSEVALANPVSPLHASPQHLSSSWFFADVYMNALEFSQTTIFSAILHNALALGISLDDLANCRIACNSPFYTPVATPRDEPLALLASRARPPHALAARTDLDAVPDSLRPTPAQFLIPHHVSLDLVPLPGLRGSAIALAAALPHLFNIWELKLDIYVRGALSVWRRGGGDGVPCQPWDRRFWEAAPWFLRKWSMAIGGEQSELGRQSMGWRALRDSRDSGVETVQPSTT